MLSTTSLKAVSAVALATSALLVGAASAAPAFATTTATYGTWSEVTEVDPSVSYTGSVSFGASGISDATYETTFDVDDSGNEVSLGTNDSNWIPAETPFGAVFGASGPSDTNFLYTDIGVDPQTTIYTFESAVPANRLGIAFGDLDYDSLVITAEDAAGNPLTGEELLGASTDNTFNLCIEGDTMPDTCDEPVTGVGTLTTNANDVAFGNNEDFGDGVSAWIFPSAEVKTLTVVHIGDDSSIRTWMAAIDGAAAVEEPVLANTAAPEAGATLWIALALGLLGVGGLVAANRRKVTA